MSTPAIIVDDIAKAYRLGMVDVKNATFRDAMVAAAKAPFLRFVSKPIAETDDDSTYWALKGVSFDVKQGEVIGLVGRNGAGKSTLLKILSRVVEPTRGMARLKGRVASLLEVGTGFHPELSGRENIYLNGAILGMKRVEIARKFDQIVEFAEVTKFLDTPVKRYSSGMYVRLAFAVAAHLEPEILIVDEVLAVGDQQFQKKCLGKMQEVSRGEGRTVLFVSHNMNAVRRLCNRCVYLKNGVVELVGPTSEVAEHYLNVGNSAGPEIPIFDRPRANGATPLIVDLKIKPLDADTLSPGCTAEIEIEYQVEHSLRNAAMGVFFDNEAGERVVGFNTRLEMGMSTFKAGRHKVKCVVDDFSLAPGKYTADVFVWSNDKQVDAVEKAKHVEVKWGDYFGTGELPNSSQGRLLKRSRWQLPAA